MSGFEDAVRRAFAVDAAPDPNLVLDPGTLVVGDRIRIEIEGEVAEVGPAVSLKVYDDWHPWAFATERLAAPTVRVYRLPKPLPPEPPVGVEVLGFTRSGAPLVFERWEDRGWATSIDGPMPWAVLLARYGPVRLLGDPIEAPR